MISTIAPASAGYKKRSKRVFFLSSNNVPSEAWAKAITSAWREIKTVLSKHEGPFYARISLAGLVLGSYRANVTWKRKEEA
jgi:hypothetical protein